MSSLVGDVMEDVGEVSPWIALLDKIGGKVDQILIDFSMDAARDEAWDFAKRMAKLDPANWPAEIELRDAEATRRGRLLLNPGWLLSLGLLVIRLRESNDIKRVIQVLSG